MTRVTTYTPGNSKTYDGTGSRNRYRDFEDRESAERWAKDQVESHGASTAKVSEIR